MKKCCVLLLLFYACQAVAQDKFSLQQCVEYALQHNISLQQSQLNVKLSAVQMQQTKYAQYPNVNADVNNGVSVGRSIDPTSNTFINQGYYFNGFSVAGNVLVFGWFARKYARQQSELDNKANVEQYKQLQNDISLNVATGYLRVLLAKEQVKINEAQLQTDLQQYSFTKKRVNAGQLPELNSAQLFAQVSADSSNVISSQLEVNSALLDLKALLNMEMNMPFDIVAVNGIASQLFALQNYPSAENIFITAVSKRPAIQANEFKIQSANKQIDIAKTAQYPSLNLGASVGTNFASTVKSLTGATYKGEEFLGNIKIADSNFAVTRPAYNYETSTVPIFTQYGNNIRQTLSLGLSVPLFNGYTAKLNIARAKINLASASLAQQQETNLLKQNIYKAYNDAQSSVQKYKASKNTEDASQIALNYAIKRYEVGLLNTQEYTVQQNTVTRAKINTVLAMYDALFKIKILDFYMGKEINLNE